MIETLAQRIARLRAALGWSQQEVAERIAVSRVALSHFELGISIPSERTVTLLAGLFKTDPPLLVAGTSYPAPKTDRLPMVSARYTEIELQQKLLERDIEWLARLDPAASEHWTERVRAQWRACLEDLKLRTADAHEQSLLSDMRSKVTHAHAHQPAPAS